MLAASESNFFASAPVVAHQIKRAQTIQGIDLLISGFTVTGMQCHTVSRPFCSYVAILCIISSSSSCRP